MLDVSLLDACTNASGKFSGNGTMFMGILFLGPLFLRWQNFYSFSTDKKRLSVSAIKGYRSMLSAAFKLKLPLISSSPILKDLLRSFEVLRPVRPLRPPS